MKGRKVKMGIPIEVKIALAHKGAAPILHCAIVEVDCKNTCSLKAEKEVLAEQNEKMVQFIKLVYELAENETLYNFRASSMKPEIERMGIEI
jgi:hypothetical protein